MSEIQNAAGSTHMDHSDSTKTNILTELFHIQMAMDSDINYNTHMQKFEKKELKKKSENLSDWYTDVILKAKALPTMRRSKAPW